MMDCIENVAYQGPDQSAVVITNGEFYWKRKGEKDVKDEDDEKPGKGRRRTKVDPVKRVE